jgi:hypothetical protein
MPHFVIGLRGDSIMRQHATYSRVIIRVAVAVTTVVALGACASIPKRAWANGQAMTSSRAYQRVMSGDMSFRTRGELQSSLDPRRLNYSEVAFPSFPKSGTWW